MAKPKTKTPSDRRVSWRSRKQSLERSKPAPQAEPNSGAGRPFQGLLYREEFGDTAFAAASQPPYFVDLGLDQIVHAATKGKEEYELLPFFWRPPHSSEAVRFRQEILRDLAQPNLVATLTAFAEAMHDVRLKLAQAQKHEHRFQKWRWRLDAANRYWTCVTQLHHDLQASAVTASGLVEFRAYLADYATSVSAVRQAAEGQSIARALSAIRYDILINGLRVQVRDSNRDADYGAAVEETFSAFESVGGRDYDFEFDRSLYVNRVEGEILALVGSIFDDSFRRLEVFSGTDDDFINPSVTQFDREIQFFLSYLEHVAKVRTAGLAFCIPTVTDNTSAAGSAIFDLALAGKLVALGTTPVCNDFRVEPPQRMIVVTGPNQGGKTTFARTIGQLHYLASLGLPTPGIAVSLALPDRIFTHFERAERMTSLRGKLQDDLVRVRAIVDHASGRSLIIINEVFASTTLRDAIWLSQAVAQRILSMGSLCVWVTFVEEVAELGEKILSMVSTVEPDNPTVRTFRVVPGPPTGLAYALSLAEKHRLNYAALEERLA